MTQDNLDPQEAFAALGRISLADHDHDLDGMLTLVAELAKGQPAQRGRGVGHVDP